MPRSIFKGVFWFLNNVTDTEKEKMEEKIFYISYKSSSEDCMNLQQYYVSFVFNKTVTVDKL